MKEPKPNSVQIFSREALAQGLPLSNIRKMDEAAVLWLEERFFDGDPSAEASKDLAAMGYTDMRLSRGAPELKRAHEACRGWRKQMLTGYRSIEALKKRGRWASDASVRRYEKGGRVSQALAQLEPKLQDHCRRCALRIGAILAGTCQKLP